MCSLIEGLLCLFDWLTAVLEPVCGPSDSCTAAGMWSI
jgi:hypothetical protein